LPLREKDMKKEPRPFIETWVTPRMSWRPELSEPVLVRARHYDDGTISIHRDDRRQVFARETLPRACWHHSERAALEAFIASTVEVSDKLRKEIAEMQAVVDQCDMAVASAGRTIIHIFDALVGATEEEQI